MTSRRDFLRLSAVATTPALGVRGEERPLAKPMRSLPKADVFVAGVGPAGFIAAIAAMRNGAKVTLAEAFGIPGGMATAGLGGPISKFNFGGKRVIGGIAWGALSGWPQSRGVEDWRKIHPKDGSWERDLGQKEQEKPGE